MIFYNQPQNDGTGVSKDTIGTTIVVEPKMRDNLLSGLQIIKTDSI